MFIQWRSCVVWRPGRASIVAAPGRNCERQKNDSYLLSLLLLYLNILKIFEPNKSYFSNLKCLFFGLFDCATRGGPTIHLS